MSYDPISMRSPEQATPQTQDTGGQGPGAGAGEGGKGGDRLLTGVGLEMLSD